MSFSPATWPQSPGDWKGTDQALEKTQTPTAPPDDPKGATAATPRATLALGTAQARPAAPRTPTTTPATHLRGGLAMMQSNDGKPEKLHAATGATRCYGGLDSRGIHGARLELSNRRQDAPVETGSRPRDGDREPVCPMFITTPAGGTMTLDVGTMNTTLTARICSAAGIPPDRQRLAFAGKPLLQDERTLEDYGVRVHSTLHALDCLCSGMPSAKTAADESAAMDTDGAKVPIPTAKSSLTAWAKWV